MFNLYEDEFLQFGFVQSDYVRLQELKKALDTEDDSIAFSYAIKLALIVAKANPLVLKAIKSELGK
jgi:hypothetical protein